MPSFRNISKTSVDLFLSDFPYCLSYPNSHAPLYLDKKTDIGYFGQVPGNELNFGTDDGPTDQLHFSAQAKRLDDRYDPANEAMSSPVRHRRRRRCPTRWRIGRCFSPSGGISTPQLPSERDAVPLPLHREAAPPPPLYRLESF